MLKSGIAQIMILFAIAASARSQQDSNVRELGGSHVIARYVQIVLQ